MQEVIFFTCSFKIFSVFYTLLFLSFCKIKSIGKKTENSERFQDLCNKTTCNITAFFETKPISRPWSAYFWLTMLWLAFDIGNVDSRILLKYMDKWTLKNCYFNTDFTVTNIHSVTVGICEFKLNLSHGNDKIKSNIAKITVRF